MKIRRSLRIVLWVLAPLFALLLILVCVGYAFYRRFYPPPPKASYSAPANALEAQRQDLDYFDRLIALDRAFSPAARAEAETQLAALKAMDKPLDHPHLRVALMQIDALADNGHSKVTTDPDAAPRVLGVRVAIFSDGLYVMRAKTADAALLGGRVVSIDGVAIEDVMKRLEALRGGTPQWKLEYAAEYMTLQDLLYATGIASDMEHSTWTVLMPSGATVTHTLDAYQPATNEPNPHVKRWYSNEPLRDLTDGWQVYSPQRPLAVTLTDFDSHFRRVRLPGSCTMLVQFKSNMNEQGQPIGEFVRGTEEDMRANPPCNLILDMRFNDGGDYTNTYRFAKLLPGLIQPGGRIFVLTGPITFSAGISSVAFVKQAGGDRVSILGEPVGDRMRFYSEGGRGCLPNYKVCVSYPTGEHDYQHACSELKDYFWLNYSFPVRIKTLEPDEFITQKFEDWREGRDPVFERALALAGQ